MAVALLLTTVPAVAPAAEAASVTYLDRVENKIDVPVNGISLKTEGYGPAPPNEHGRNTGFFSGGLAVRYTL